MKRALDINDQIALLKERGMEFGDEAEAKSVLLDIGYYRLGFYAFPFERSYPRLTGRDHEYNRGTAFKHIVELYSFDASLREILLSALSRIEVNIRTKIVYYASDEYRQSPTWFADKTVMEAAFVDGFSEKIYTAVKKNPAIERHHVKYINDIYAPAWKTIEFMTLGNLTALFRAFRDTSVKSVIAGCFSCSTGVFQSYLDAVRVIRNKCAHGNCLYNLSFSKGFKGAPAGVSAANRHNIAGAVKVIWYLLSRISTGKAEDFKDRITSLLTMHRNPEVQDVIDGCTGFAENIWGFGKK